MANPLALPSHRVFVGEVVEGRADGGDAVEDNHDWQKDYSKNDNARLHESYID